MVAGLRGPWQGAKDEDEDGYNNVADCDDSDLKVHPGAEERCDGVDQNCAWADWDCVGDGRAAVLSLGEPPFVPDVTAGDVDADGVADLIWSEPGACCRGAEPAPRGRDRGLDPLPVRWTGRGRRPRRRRRRRPDPRSRHRRGRRDLSGWFGPIVDLTVNRPPDFTVTRLLGESAYPPIDHEVIGDLDGDGLRDLALAYFPQNKGPPTGWAG